MKAEKKKTSEPFILDEETGPKIFNEEPLILEEESLVLDTEHSENTEYKNETTTKNEIKVSPAARKIASEKKLIFSQFKAAEKMD